MSNQYSSNNLFQEKIKKIEESIKILEQGNCNIEDFKKIYNDAIYSLKELKNQLLEMKTIIEKEFDD